jgi:hypothetical protein
MKAISTGLGNLPKTSRYGGIFILSTLILSTIAFGGERIAGEIIDFNQGLYRHFYRNAQWHFFCTLWVVLEGAIMIYVWQIYLMLKQSHRIGEKRGRPKRPTGGRPGIAVTALVVGFFLFFALYEYHTLSLLRPMSINATQLDRIFDFYLNICGVVWIVFDGGVAVLGYKTYRRLLNLRKPSMAQSHPNNR